MSLATVISLNPWSTCRIVRGGNYEKWKKNNTPRDRLLMELSLRKEHQRLSHSPDNKWKQERKSKKGAKQGHKHEPSSPSPISNIYPFPMAGCIVMCVVKVECAKQLISVAHPEKKIKRMENSRPCQVVVSSVVQARKRSSNNIITPKIVKAKGASTMLFVWKWKRRYCQYGKFE